MLIYRSANDALVVTRDEDTVGEYRFTIATKHASMTLTLDDFRELADCIECDVYDHPVRDDDQ